MGVPGGGECVGVERVTAGILGKAQRKLLNATFAELKRYTHK